MLLPEEGPAVVVSIGREAIGGLLPSHAGIERRGPEDATVVP